MPELLSIVIAGLCHMPICMHSESVVVRIVLAHALSSMPTCSKTPATSVPKVLQSLQPSSSSPTHQVLNQTATSHGQGDFHYEIMGNGMSLDVL